MRIAASLLAVALVACAVPAEEDVAPSSGEALSGVHCGRPTTGQAYARGVATGSVVLYDVGGQPMEASMFRAFRRLSAVHAAIAISPEGATVFRSMAVQQGLAVSLPALAAVPGWSNHQSGHAVDLDTTTLPSEATLACFGFARPYALGNDGALVETTYGHTARRRYDEGCAPPGKTADSVRRQVAGEPWHYEFDEALAAELTTTSATCRELDARARAALGGDCSGEDAEKASCTSASLGREVPSGACVFRGSDASWNRCDDGTWAEGVSREACGVTDCAALTASERRCPLTAAGRATDTASALCGKAGAIAPATDGSRDWRCDLAACSATATQCWR